MGADLTGRSSGGHAVRSVAGASGRYEAGRGTQLVAQVDHVDRQAEDPVHGVVGIQLGPPVGRNLAARENFQPQCRGIVADILQLQVESQVGVGVVSQPALGLHVRDCVILTRRAARIRGVELGHVHVVDGAVRPAEERHPVYVGRVQVAEDRVLAVFCRHVPIRWEQPARCVVGDELHEVEVAVMPRQIDLHVLPQEVGTARAARRRKLPVIAAARGGAGVGTRLQKMVHPIVRADLAVHLVADAFELPPDLEDR
eukprot:4268721-Prymnesium_polylepis.1